MLYFLLLVLYHHLPKYKNKLHFKLASSFKLLTKEILKFNLAYETVSMNMYS